MEGLKLSKLRVIKLWALSRFHVEKRHRLNKFFKLKTTLAPLRSAVNSVDQPMTPCPSAVEYVTPVFAKNYQVSLTHKNWIFPAILKNILWDMCSAFLSINCTQKQTKCLNKLVALLSFEIKSSAKRCAFHFVYLCITYLIWTVSGEQIKNERCLWNPVIPLWQRNPCQN